MKVLALSALALLLCSHSQAQTTVAGHTPGSFRVTESGAAEFRIPIQVPPGVAGVEPRLALSYNSQSGNGIAGMGWTLQGLSAITRCPQTIAQDGARGAVRYDWNDRYCLDGQRLILVSGTYGGNNAEYRTEREIFSKIHSYGTEGQGPMFFTAWTKSGEMIHYGYFQESRIQAQGRAEIRVWAQSHLYDRHGNSIVVSYAEDAANSDFYPIRIDYGGAGAPAQQWLTFHYATRPDQPPSWHQGAVSRTTQLLTTIKAFSAAGQVREYRLAYNQAPSTYRSRLHSIEECSAGGDCKAPITVAWQDGTTGYNPWNWGSYVPGSANEYDHYHADVNGDGRADWIQVLKGANSGWVALSNGDGSFAMWGWGSVGIGAGNAYRHYFADVNGDGKADWIQVYKPGNGAWVGLSNGDGTFPTWTWSSSNVGAADAYDHYFADVDGDGRADWIQVQRDAALAYVGLSNGDGSFQVWTWSTATLGGGNRFEHHFADVDGDGKADWIQISKAGSGGWVGLSNGNGSFNLPGWGSYMIGAASQYQHKFADVNGDGKADWIQISRSAYGGWVSLSAGDSSFPGWNWGSYMIGPADQYQHELVDVNGDGKADWIQITRAANGGYVSFSPGDGSFPAWTWGSYNIGDANSYAHYFADINGDGKADWIQVGRAIYVGYSGLATGLVGDLATSLGDGLGNSTTIAYAPITNAAIYAKDSGAAYPVLDLQVPFYVVASSQASNGTGGFQATTHVYGGLRAESGTGRGLLGFRWMESTQQSTGLKVRSEFAQTWPYVGMPSLMRRTESSGAVLSEVTNTLGCVNPAGGGACTVAAGNRYFPYVSQSVETASDLNGATLPTVTTTTQYDAYGNATSVSVSTGDGHSKVTSNVFTNDVPGWLLGRLTRSTVQSTTP